ncbi:MAG: hypothetical protein RSC75_09410 [Bacteroidales bacterium]
MKILILLSFLIATGCQISDQEKAKNIITQAINENLPNKESYIPISFDTLKIANMPFEKTYNYCYQKESIERYKEYIKRTEHNIKKLEENNLRDNFYESLIKDQENYTKELESEVSNFYTYKNKYNAIEGYMMNHTFSFFNLDKGRRDTVNCLFFFDPSLNHLYATASFNQEEGIYNFRFTSTHAK